VWLGTTTEDAERYRMRWPILSRVPAALRFVSYEPAIGPIGAIEINKAACLPDWIICGGESGGGARVMNPAWARYARDQCRVFGIAFFHKQWGTYHSNPLVYEQGLSLAESALRDPPSNGKGGGLLDKRFHRSFPGERAVVTRQSV
jgi:protein gp37